MLNMNQEEKILLKKRLKQFCQTILEQRIEVAKAVIENAQQSANNEEKSSAGDKYETGRAMSHLEKDMHTRQLTEHLKELSALHTINAETIYNHVTGGAFLKCAGISLFIATGLGKQTIDGETILFLSPNAPLAKLLEHKKAGEHFLFNKKSIAIEEIF